jgi:hypothetical protein
MRHDPIAPPRIHSANCSCPRCRHWRLQEARTDCRALAGGLILGAICSTALLTVHFWPTTIAPALGF